jgi:hypothetical protein
MSLAYDFHHDSDGCRYLVSDDVASREWRVDTCGPTGFRPDTTGLFLDSITPEPSWRVDVVCQPLGWLGTFRRSRRSGLWFTGRHRWHELGCRRSMAVVG